jgi:hypothetical protein
MWQANTANVAGWPQRIAPPGLPRIRTCPIEAYGSSGHGFATRGYTEWTIRGLASGNTFKIAAIRSQYKGRLERALPCRAANSSWPRDSLRTRLPRGNCAVYPLVDTATIVLVVQRHSTSDSRYCYPPLGSQLRAICNSFASVDGKCPLARLVVLATCGLPPLRRLPSPRKRQRPPLREQKRPSSSQAIPDRTS